ncbi:MAG: tetratricopeptide repeat protein [Pseudomonadota bacterium]
MPVILRAIFLILPLVFSAWSPAAASSTASDRLLTSGKRALAGADYDRAVLLFEQSMTANPKNASAYGYLAKSYQEMGETRLARKYVDLALEVDPDNVTALEQAVRLDLADNSFDAAGLRLERLERVCAGAVCPDMQALQATLRLAKDGGDEGPTSAE